MKITEQPFCAYLNSAKCANTTLKTIFVIFLTVEKNSKKFIRKSCRPKLLPPVTKLKNDIFSSILWRKLSSFNIFAVTNATSNSSLLVCQRHCRLICHKGHWHSKKPAICNISMDYVKSKNEVNLTFKDGGKIVFIIK